MADALFATQPFRLLTRRFDLLSMQKKEKGEAGDITTAQAVKEAGDARRFVGCDVSQEWVNIGKHCLKQVPIGSNAVVGLLPSRWPADFRSWRGLTTQPSQHG